MLSLETVMNPHTLDRADGGPTNKSLIYLSDLTYTGRVMASNMMPLGIGLIGAYLLRARPRDVEIELFKYPGDLSQALSRRLPRVIGFASYTWNCDLAYEYATRIKRHSPETVVVFGGPNYGLRPAEIAEYWRCHPLIDFQVVLEGERAFAELVATLAVYNFEAETLKASRVKPANCHYMFNGELVAGSFLPRLEIDELPSPYQTGLMDKFFDGVLTPLIHTTRGCPFTCTFCSEGAAYFNKVKQRVDLLPELEYIATRVGTVKDVFITDANFGMYREDIEKAQLVAGIRERHGWPERIYVSTGKNQQERILQTAAILKGAMNIGASLQSTDQDVLEKIERTNISIDALQRVASNGNKDTTTYTELILCLPGDTLKKYTQSLRDVVTAAMGVIRTYQLTLIPQTELSSPESRTKHGMVTAFRIMQRSVGRYELFGEAFASVEPEEICVSNSTMSAPDWEECRELGLTVEIIHNNDMFTTLAELCKYFKLSWFDFLLAFHAKRRSYSGGITHLYDTFRKDITEGFWSSREALLSDVLPNIDTYLNDTEGTNEISKGKANATFVLFEELQSILFSELKALLEKEGLLTDNVGKYLAEAEQYSKHSKLNFLDHSIPLEADFHYSHTAVHDGRNLADCIDARSANSRTVRFYHTTTQRDIIENYTHQHGTSIDGLGKILMRAPIKRLFRTAEVVPPLSPSI